MTTVLRSQLFEGKVRHRRSRPSAYQLEHDVYYFGLDLSELDAVARRLWLVSRNRRNVVAFRDDDHLATGGGPLREQVDRHLRGMGLDPSGLRVMLVTNLRVLGYVFNPASFYLCEDAEGRLAALLIDVHNTHGERHVYPLLPDTSGERFTASMDKAFYVSPFIDMEARYRVQVLRESGRLRITIVESQEGEHLLSATLVLRRVPLSDRALARLLLRHPLVPQKTIAAIHLHAFRLWRRGLRFRRHRSAVGVARG